MGSHNPIRLLRSSDAAKWNRCVDHGIESSGRRHRLTFEYTWAAFYSGLGDDNQNVSAWDSRRETGKEGGYDDLYQALGAPRLSRACRHRCPGTASYRQRGGD